MTGRSSAVSLPICLSTAVSSPFLPRYLTRRVSKSAASLALAKAARASCLILSSCSFILHPPKNEKSLSSRLLRDERQLSSAVPPEPSHRGANHCTRFIRPVTVDHPSAYFPAETPGRTSSNFPGWLSADGPPSLMETVKSAIFPFIVFYNGSSVSQKDLKIKRENPIM